MSQGYFVYMLVDPRDNQPFYVGKGCGNRPAHHSYETKSTTSNRRKYNKIQKILNSGLTPQVNMLYTSLSEAKAFTLEIKTISKYGRKGYDKNGILLNICEGGTQPPGSVNFITNNPSTRDKGKTYEERYGTEKAQEMKEVRSNKFRGRQFSSESKQKMSESAKLRAQNGGSEYKKRPVVTPDGTFGSVSEAAEFYEVTYPNIIYRIKSSLVQWIDYQYS